MPRVSVVMAVYNAADFLHEAVASVLAQTYRDFELIAVEDASHDDSLSILQSFDDPRIRIIQHQANMGAALSRNDGLVEARGEFVAIMDADDLCAPNRFERQVAFLDANPLVGLLGCGIYDNIDARGDVLYTSYLPEDNETIQRTLLEQWCFLHPSIMFRTELHEFVGGYRMNPKGLSVIGHQYINELGETAMRLAQRRRSSLPECMDDEIDRLLELKRRRKAPGGVRGAVQSWRDSMYAANRYYGFGCRELCTGNLERARRCFLVSLRTNVLFVKSWIGVTLTLLPFAASRLKFAFRSSMRHCDDVGRLRSSISGTLST
jgi:glycosyltransferase involved in cell wall biosynthesis